MKEKTIADQIKDGSLPVFPTTYAKQVVDHAEHKKTRGKGKNPSMAFLEERNPRESLKQAEAVLEKPDGLIRQRLQELEKHMPGQQRLVYEFAKHIASHTNAELVPQGFVMAATLALYDLQTGVDGFTQKPIRSQLVGQPAMVYRVIELMIPAIAESIFPPDFAGGVRQTMDAVHEIQRQEWEAEKAAAPKPTISGDPLQIYTAARRVADLWFEQFRDVDDRRREGVNPYYKQTTGGLFLEQYYGIPGSIWTPWGEWNCWGGGSGGNQMQNFLVAIGEVTLFAPEQHSSQGTVGPIYAIFRVGDIVLPKPELRQRASYFEYEEANRLWAEVSKQYKKAQSAK